MKLYNATTSEEFIAATKAMDLGEVELRILGELVALKKVENIEQAENNTLITDAILLNKILQEQWLMAKRELLTSAMRDQIAINEQMAKNENLSLKQRTEALNRNLELQADITIKSFNDFLSQNRKAVKEGKEAAIKTTEVIKIMNDRDIVSQTKKILALNLTKESTLELLRITASYRAESEALTESISGLDESSVLYAKTLSEVAALTEDLMNNTNLYDEGSLDRAIENAKKEVKLAEKKNEDLIRAEEVAKADFMHLDKESIEFKEKMAELEIKIKKRANEETTQAELDATKKLYLLLKEQRNKINEEELAQKKEILDRMAELYETIVDKRRDKAQSALDDELDSLEERMVTIRAAINAGNSEAASSLAELEKKKAENEAKQEKLRQREIRDRKIIAGLELLAANANSPNALGKTVTDVTLLINMLSNTPNYFDGTEDTGTVANPLDSNGGRHTILHDNERVMTAKQNIKVGGMSNDDLADLASMHNSGNLVGGTTIVQQSNKELVSEVKAVTQAIKSIPVHQYNYDANQKFHVHTMETNNKKEIHKQKANNLFK